jgi:hypothetical protein
MKELITASRMSCLLDCPRKHYWRYECGLRRDVDAMALRFGTAWHAGMEARWQKLPYEDALKAALDTATDFDEATVATISGLLAGYYARWNEDPVKDLCAEVEFRAPLQNSRTFDVAGKIDGLGILHDGRLALVEHKTTSADVGPDSDYWIRLRSNPQINQYVLAARALGWDVRVVIYDVTRKPTIRPLSNIPTLDQLGFKIVLDSTGARVFKKDGSPRETADAEKGYAVQGAPETPEQYAERLAADAQERPDFYFARREVPILEDDLEEFAIQRSELAKMILNFRAAARRSRLPHHGWPRHLGEFSCRTCDYASFCLQNIVPDPALPPAGFRVGVQNPELTQPAAT